MITLEVKRVGHYFIQGSNAGAAGANNITDFKPVMMVHVYHQNKLVHCKNLRVVLTLLWVVSVACSGASILPSIVNAAIWTWPQRFLLFIRTDDGSFIRTEDIVPLLWPHNYQKG